MDSRIVRRISRRSAAAGTRFLLLINLYVVLFTPLIYYRTLSCKRLYSSKRPLPLGLHLKSYPPPLPKELTRYKK